MDVDFLNETFKKITKNRFYQHGILYGKPRRGHGEGTIAAHIAELERNLEIVEAMRKITEEEHWKSMILIHVHDTFKGCARRDAAILDPDSHASLAREFLEAFLDDKDMLNIVQYHDLGYAVYKKREHTGRLDEEKLMRGLNAIKNKDLFLLFSIIDTCTVSKGREMIRWLVEEVSARFPFPETTVTTGLILPGPDRIGDAW